MKSRLSGQPSPSLSNCSECNNINSSRQLIAHMQSTLMGAKSRLLQMQRWNVLGVCSLHQSAAANAKRPTTGALGFQRETEMLGVSLAGACASVAAESVDAAVSGTSTCTHASLFALDDRCDFAVHGALQEYFVCLAFSSQHPSYCSGSAFVLSVTTIDH